jgi:hypothetical protein
MIVTRALAGFLYAITSLLYWQLGHEQEADRLAERDTAISQLQARIEALNQSFETKVVELSNQLKARDEQVNRLAERASSLTRDALDNYPKVMMEWIEKGVKTVSVNEIEQVTGLSRQRINAAVKGGKIQRDNRNKELLRVSSVIEWLKTIPVIESSNGISHGDTPPLGLPALSV